MRFLYNIFIQLYLLGIHVAAWWNPKAKQWLTGRKQLFAELAAKIPAGTPLIWVHAASAGEFEQAKPVIEALKEKHTGYKVLVSFFSPSGFNAAKKYPHADVITYLPADTAANARHFVQLLNPKLVIFIKYDFWYHHLAAVAARQIPLLLVSSIFRNNQIFFKPYGGLFKRMLRFFTHLFVQDETSVQLLKKHRILHSSAGGDTRFDRVIKITTQPITLPFIADFVDGKPAVVAGSTWPDDETLLSSLRTVLPDLKLIIAPHEINEGHIQSILKLFPGALRYTTLSQQLISDWSANPVLIIDNIGMLSRLYHYASLTYIGGGFSKSGIHNTLEAAVYGKPVLFGPNYSKFKEAKELLTCGGAISISNETELKAISTRLLNDSAALQKSGQSAGAYVSGHTGATGRVMAWIAEKRLL